jgi:hypothetical protein
MNAMFTLLPQTFVLPKEFLQFAEAFGKASMATAAPAGSSSTSAPGASGITAAVLASLRNSATSEGVGGKDKSNETR